MNVMIENQSGTRETQSVNNNSSNNSSDRGPGGDGGTISCQSQANLS
jgi:hypothetical protein